MHIPSPEAELVLLAAHATLKELTITLADFLHAVYLTKQVGLGKGVRYRARPDLAVAFSAFASAVNAMNALLFRADWSPHYYPLHHCRPAKQELPVW